MTTDELITLLARAPKPRHDSRAAARHFRRTLLTAALLPLAAVLVLVVLQRQTLAPHGAVLWLKLAFAGASAAAAGALLWAEGHPGMRAGRAWRRLAWPCGALWLLAGAFLLRAEPQQWASLLAPAFDGGVRHCAAGVLLLALPALLWAIVALRGLAPTKPAVAGAAAGVFAGSVGALAFALVCTEVRLPVVALGYPVGIVLAAVAGAAAGGRVLRW